jgi:hypothetical protein
MRRRDCASGATGHARGPRENAEDLASERRGHGHYSYLSFIGYSYPRPSVRKRTMLGQTTREDLVYDPVITIRDRSLGHRIGHLTQVRLVACKTGQFKKERDEGAITH